MHAPTRRSRYSLSNASEALSACRYAPGFPAGESSDFGSAECRMDLGPLRTMAGRQNAIALAQLTVGEEPEVLDEA